VKVEQVIQTHDFVLKEAAVVETIAQLGSVRLHERLEEAALIYDDEGRRTLRALYHGFISLAHEGGVPILLGTPTWRANAERVAEAGIQYDLNGDAVRFLDGIREEWGAWKDRILIGGTIGCKNDAYRPEQGLEEDEAEAFHSWQLDRLARAGSDFLSAVTLPALPEAVGIAKAMERTGIPFILSFVIDRQGHILDGTRLEQAFEEIDGACTRPPLGYMVNCSYPSFLHPEALPEAALARLIGYQANASALDHKDLDRAEDILAEDVSDWGERMIALNRRFGLTVLGGCCGTGLEHLGYLVRRLCREPGNE
jgi:S-methylmethionine-dependent homocysteine/selenocysteine methylase